MNVNVNYCMISGKNWRRLSKENYRHDSARERQAVALFKCPSCSFWQAVIDMGVKEAVLEIIEVEGHGDTAIEVSKFKMKDTNGNELDHGKYIVIWKQEDGAWKLHYDIWNSSLAQQ